MLTRVVVATVALGMSAAARAESGDYAFQAPLAAVSLLSPVANPGKIECVRRYGERI